MANYRFTNKALDDLSEIWSYTYYKSSENQMDKYKMLIKDCKEIASNPNEPGKTHKKLLKI